ncbi:uncharacterized protein TRUGW13939_07599 [Talaromyces rugulosus]|uniref:Uncharacterized protein n=1 Tax=Talaromyces rugulosus TaxID=121627 RepID=A0A7H8R249_TALRU|nr:uncharacterized protein TRUGW13939_07599 [Talaromyces rugulosus]QKX60454.1 hypothetical protein TRUGW13939_07599 [Talaromyces rugulosus]
MAPIKNIVTSALMLTAAVAAPVELDRKSHAIADAPTRTHMKHHHGQPMHRASPAISGLPSGTFNAQAMESSALAAAANIPAGSQDDGIFSILDNLPLEKERRQLDELTRFLTEVNQAVKRDTVTRRQLSTIKSAPAAVGQLANVLSLAESLPLKRDESKRFDDIGGVGHFINGIAKPKLDDLARRGGGGGGLDLDSILGGLAKRGEEKDGADNEHYTKQGDTLLRELNSMLDKAGKGKEDEGSQATPKPQELSGLANLVRRAMESSSQLTERGGVLDGLGGLDGLAGAVNGLAKREDMTDEQVKRQLNVASAIATGALSSAGGAVSQPGKLATGNVRRTSIQGSQADPVAASMLPVEGTKPKDTNNDDDTTGPGEINKEVASAEETAEAATKKIGSATNKGPAKGPLGKRQLPPIAGADLPTVVMGLAANPSIVMAPITHGVKLAGTDLGDALPK